MQLPNPPNNSRSSPKPRSKQTQSDATPISKKAAEYAGPSFNHSPAPANLPPPPFLSKAFATRDPSASGSGTSLPSGASPLSFLFNAQQEEASSGEKFRYGSSAMSIHEGRGYNSDNDIRKARPGVFEIESGILQPGYTTDSKANNNSDSENLVAQRSKKSQPKPSPWAHIEKPATAGLFEVESSPLSEAERQSKASPVHRAADKSAKLGKAQSSVPVGQEPRSHRLSVMQDEQSSPLKGKKVQEGSKRRVKPKKDVQVPHSAQGPKAKLITPKTILKRETPLTATIPSTSQNSPRVAPSSTFKAVRRRVIDEEKYQSSDTADSEEELKYQAANLRNMLKLPTPARVDSPTQAPNQNGSVARDVSSSIESDLRRLLKLGA